MGGLGTGSENVAMLSPGLFVDHGATCACAVRARKWTHGGPGKTAFFNHSNVISCCMWGSIAEIPALPDLDFPIKLLNIGSVVANFDFVRPPRCHSHQHRHFISFYHFFSYWHQNCHCSFTYIVIGITILTISSDIPVRSCHHSSSSSWCHCPHWHQRHQF